MSSIIKQQSYGIATETQDGLVSIGDQTFAGVKTFSDGIEIATPLSLDNGMSEAYSIELSGTYNANTYYPIANSSNLPSGVYMLFIYQSTYLAGLSVYQFTWSYGPAAMFTYYTNTTDSVGITLTSGSGHARNGVNAPVARIRGTFSSDGKEYVDISFPGTLSSLNATDGRQVRVYFKRIA